MLLGWWPTASSPSASSPMSPWGRFPSRARRSESVSKYDLKYLLVPYWCCRCWSYHQSSLKTSQVWVGLVCAEQGCQEDCSGWCQELIAGELWDGEWWTQIFWYALQCWSIDFSQAGMLSSVLVWDSLLPPSFFLTYQSRLPTGPLMTQELSLIQCVQKSPQFGPFPKKHQFLNYPVMTWSLIIF